MADPLPGFGAGAPGDTAASRLLEHARAQPDAEAFIDAGHLVTYAALGDSALAACAWLHHAGVRAGQTVALALDEPAATDPKPELLLGVLYGLMHLGATILPLYPDMPESARALAMTMYRALWHVGAGAAGPIGPAAPLDLCEFFRAYASWQGRSAPGGGDADRPSLYHFTSGSTGEPKVCLFTARQLARWSWSSARPFGSSARDRIASPRPWPHMVGLRAMLRAHGVGGVFVNVAVPRTREQLDALVRSLGVTEIGMSPFQFRMLLRSPVPAAAIVEPRVLSVAGGLITPDEILEARRTLARGFYVDYGFNEIGRVAVLGPNDPVDAPGCVGRLTPDVEAQAVDADHRPLPAAAAGILRFRAPWMPDGYVGNASLTAERFRDGWFYPGDAGCVDERGYLTVSGRTDDVINLGGLKISPADVEAVLKQHLAIEDTAVVSVPDPMSGEKPVAFLVLRKGQACPQGEDLVKFCAGRMDRLRVPRTYLIVDAFPYGPDGKLDRTALRDLYLARGNP